MAIVDSELKTYKALVVNDTSSNGGRMSANQVITGVAAALLPNATPAERTSGITRHRKAFFKVANGLGLGLVNPKLFMDKNTPGDDKVTFFAATQRNTASAITGSERKYGCGTLQTTTVAAATSLAVVVEDGSVTLFASGDLVRVTDKASLTGSGNEEYVTLSAAPTVVGNVVTLTFASTPLTNAYSSSATKVSSVYVPATVQPTFDNNTVTSTSGTYDFSGSPVGLRGDSCIEQTWTLTFTSATAFNIVGDTVGAKGSGSISAGALPSNPDFSQPYFNLVAAGFGGTFSSGDTIIFQTHPAAVPVWVKQIIPAGANVASGNLCTFGFIGETS